MSKYSEYFTYLKAKYIKIGSVQINEISTDGTLAGNSDLCVPTEKAVKTYIDLHAPETAAHTLTGASHTESGLTGGHFLKATGATTFGFAAHGLTASSVGAIPNATTGATAPSSTPSAVGLFYLDTTGKKAYVSMGVGSSADWVILN